MRSKFYLMAAPNRADFFGEARVIDQAGKLKPLKDHLLAGHYNPESDWFNGNARIRPDENYVAIIEVKEDFIPKNVVRVTEWEKVID